MGETKNDAGLLYWESRYEGVSCHNFGGCCTDRVFFEVPLEFQILAFRPV